MQKKGQVHTYGFWEGFLIGSTLGAMTTFVIGTKKGKELRETLSEKFHLLQPKIKHLQRYLNHAQKKVMKSHLFQDAKKIVLKNTRKKKRKAKR